MLDACMGRLLLGLGNASAKWWREGERSWRDVNSQSAGSVVGLVASFRQVGPSVSEWLAVARRLSRCLFTLSAGPQG